jgi:hypothetical protein
VDAYARLAAHASALADRHPDWPWGSAYYAALHALAPHLADALAGSALDPQGCDNVAAATDAYVRARLTA